MCTSSCGDDCVKAIDLYYERTLCGMVQKVSPQNSYSRLYIYSFPLSSLCADLNIYISLYIFYNIFIFHSRQFTDCLCEIEAWMRARRLRLNPQKTQLIWLGSRQQLDKLNITDVQLLSTTLRPQSTVRSLVLGSQL